MTSSKVLWLFNIWQDYLENLVISAMRVLGKGGNSIYANHMSFKSQIKSAFVYFSSFVFGKTSPPVLKREKYQNIP